MLQLLRPRDKPLRTPSRTPPWAGWHFQGIAALSSTTCVTGRRARWPGKAVCSATPVRTPRTSCPGPAGGLGLGCGHLGVRVRAHPLLSIGTVGSRSLFSKQDAPRFRVGLLPAVLSHAVPSLNLHLVLDLEGRLFFNPQASSSDLSPSDRHLRGPTLTSSPLPLSFPSSQDPFSPTPALSQT